MNRRDFLKTNLQALTFASVGSALMASNFLAPTQAIANEAIMNKKNGNKPTIGILLFDDVEVLDFAGPFEVLSLPYKGDYNNKVFDVITISEDGKLISATNGLQVQPDYSIHNMPKVDIMIIPGGGGTDAVSKNATLMKWIKDISKEVEIMASVCTGALLLAQAGLLDGKKATTHIGLLDQLENNYPSCTVIRGVKFVDEGNVITSAGISAGIEMSFHLVQKLVGLDAAKETAYIMEYDIVFD